MRTVGRVLAAIAVGYGVAFVALFSLDLLAALAGSNWTPLGDPVGSFIMLAAWIGGGVWWWRRGARRDPGKYRREQP